MQKIVVGRFEKLLWLSAAAALLEGRSIFLVLYHFPTTGREAHQLPKITPVPIMPWTIQGLCWLDTVVSFTQVFPCIKPRGL